MTNFQYWNGVFLTTGTTVYAVHTLGVSTPTGSPATYSEGETVTWNSGTGTGKFISYGTNILKLYRTSGVQPALTDVVAGATASSTITSITRVNSRGVTVNPPNFNATDRQNAIVPGDIVFAQDGRAQNIYAIVASPVDQVDKFEILTTWGGPELIDVPSFVGQDFTPNLGWSIPSQGDGQPLAAMRKTFLDIDAYLGTEAWTVVNAAGGAAPAFATNWQNTALGPAEGAVEFYKHLGRVYLRGACNKTTTMSYPDTIFTLPVGYRPARLQSWRVAGLSTTNIVMVTTGGLVQAYLAGSWESGTSGWGSLSSISFRQEG